MGFKHRSCDNNRSRNRRCNMDLQRRKIIKHPHNSLSHIHILHDDNNLSNDAKSDKQVRT